MRNHILLLSDNKDNKITKTDYMIYFKGEKKEVAEIVDKKYFNCRKKNQTSINLKRSYSS